MLDKRSHVPLYIQLKDEIAAKIKEGIWDVDSQIPSEKALIEEYGVGRATVREALSHLVNEGYLYKRHGIGTFVSRNRTSLGFEPLISLTYSLKARGVEPVNIIEAMEEITPNKALISKLKWTKKKPCFYIRRLRMAKDIPLAIEESYFPEEYKDIGSKWDLTGSIAKMLLEGLNITIRKVEQTVVPRMPTEKEQQELKIDSGVQVLEMERWIYTAGRDEPFYYLHFIIVGNIYTFE